MEAHSYAVLGDSLLQAGRAADAEQAYQRSLELRPAAGDRRGEGRMLERIARSLLAQGRAAEAAVILEQGAAVAAEIGSARLGEVAPARR